MGNERVKMVCRECGSEDVSAEVTAVRWDKEAQRWEVTGDLCDKGHYCDDCDGECRIDEVPMDGFDGMHVHVPG